MAGSLKDTIAKLRELRAKAERPEEDYILHEKAAASRAKALYAEALLEAAPDLLAAAEETERLRLRVAQLEAMLPGDDVHDWC